MATLADFLQAKQILSGRLLRATALSGGIGMRMANTMAAAASAAGRNVHAVGIGKKIVDNKETDTLAIRFYITQKIAPSALAPRDQLPGDFNGFPTDTIESPMAVLAGGGAAVAPLPCSDSRQQQQRPVIGGISAGHPDVTAGTIACFCMSTRVGDDPNVVCVLSNNHIFANLNRASVGDPLYQPGSIDGGTPSDAFATVKRWKDLQIDGVTPNRVDAAIGEMMSGVAYDPQICMLGRVTGIGTATLGQAIRKHGRTSGYTEGTVDDASVDALVQMDPNDPNSAALFQNQMRLIPTPSFRAIGLGGDSGSLVMDLGSQTAVGLYFANPPSGEYAYANQIGDVVSVLQIDLL